jgi:cyclopropane fatty-acyl-phospholipid synthase-like methyltransferase
LAEFDTFASDYGKLVSESVRITGESSDYFAAYKADYIVRKIGPRAGARLLDYGCGIGLLSAHLKKRLATVRVDGFDVSKDSLNLVDAALLCQGTFTTNHGELAAAYDVIVLANVLHHVKPEKRPGLLKEVSSRLAQGGKIVVFEHNPLNPLTRLAVSKCPFDKGVELLSSRETSNYFRRDGFEGLSRDYVVFFPRWLAWLRSLERSLAWCPLGAQYAVVAGGLRH